MLQEHAFPERSRNEGDRYSGHLASGSADDDDVLVNPDVPVASRE